MNKLKFLAGLILAAAWLPGFARTVVRVGAFPNITHAQAMIGKANGWFDKGLGPRAKIQWASTTSRTWLPIFSSECRAY